LTDFQKVPGSNLIVDPTDIQYADTVIH